MTLKVFVGNGNGSGANWTGNNNWSPSGAPTSGDDVTINTGVTVNYNVTSGQPHL
jgi:hypothetical protein